MAKSLHELKEKRIKKALAGLSYPMVYVRQAWYVDDNEVSESYRSLQQRMRKEYPELVRRITTPPWPYAASQLAKYWNAFGEQSRSDIGSLHALLYMRLEWFTETMLRRDNNTGLVDLDYERMHSHYRDDEGLTAMTRAEDVMKLVNTALGGDVLKMATEPEFTVQNIPTGVLPMDILLHGGLPRGRFCEIYGDFSSLKSYIGLSAIAQVQQAGGVAAVIDTEHSFDEAWAQGIGVDTKTLIIQRPENGELAMDTAEALIRAEVDLIVFDSVAAALPKAEQEKRLYGEKVQPGRLAYLMSTALRKLTAANTKTAILWINQTRLNIGITFGSPEAIPGGKSLPFYASHRISMKKVGKVTRDRKQYSGDKWENTKEQIGQKYKAEVTKSKLSRPFRDVFFTWDLEAGKIDIPGFLLAQGLEEGIITLKGNTWEYANGGVKAVGRQKFVDALTSNQAAQETLENDIRTVHDLPLMTTPSTSRGSQEADPKKDSEPKRRSSSRAAAGSTRGQGQARSKKTAVRRRNSSK